MVQWYELLNLISERLESSLYMEKVVVFLLKKEGFVLLTIHKFRSGDEGWSIIPDMPTPYDDVCVFEIG